MQKMQMHHNQGRLGISLTMECTTPNNPDKICVVFDCSAEFQGRSINKELLSGPDLTSQIIDILTRFCEEKIVFMSDVEAIYHQVQVPEDQQLFLKFPWCENHEI